MRPKSMFGYAAFAVIAALLSVPAGEATAATLPISDNFNDGSLGAQLEQETSDTWNFTDHDSDGDNEAFPTVAESREYIRTVDSDYNTVDFTADITLNMPTDSNSDAWALSYFGLGDGVPDTSYFDVPTHSAHLLLRPNGNLSLQINDGSDRETVEDWSSNIDGGTHRARMTKSGNNLTFLVDMEWGGSGFTADHTFTTFDLSAANLDHLTTSTSRFFFGSGAESDGTAKASFDDFNAVPEPGSALLLLLGGSLAALLRNRLRPQA